MEMACPSWNESLTKKNIDNLEKLQKTALKIILGQSYISYDKALEKFDLQKLTDRRLFLCESFAKKSVKSDKFSSWFVRNPRQNRNSLPFIPPNARTEAFASSPIPYLTRLLNTIY